MRAVLPLFVVAAVVLIISAPVADALVSQYVCADSLCTVNCQETKFHEGLCYKTSQAGTTIEVWCRSEGTVLKQRIWPYSNNCSGWAYDYPVSTAECAQELNGYNYVEYFCNAGSSDGKGKEGTHQQLPVVVEPVPSVLRSLMKNEGKETLTVERSRGGLEIPLAMFPTLDNTSYAEMIRTQNPQVAIHTSSADEKAASSAQEIVMRFLSTSTVPLSRILSAEEGKPFATVSLAAFTEQKHHQPERNVHVDLELRVNGTPIPLIRFKLSSRNL